jgi:PhoD-like phosphatase
VKPWAIAVWNRIHADPATDGYFDFRLGDVHCLTLDGRRYADPVDTPDTPAKTKLGRRQLDWARRILATSDARLFVVFSADTFAAREDPRTHAPIDDCFITGWPADYRRMLTAFVDVQLTGRRVLVLSGDAHGLRMHHHPDPAGRPEAAQLPVVEFICSGLRPELWSAARQGDPSLDRSRYVLGVPGAGMLVVDPPGATPRTVTLRAIDARAGHRFDAFAPLRLPFAPGPYPGA